MNDELPDGTVDASFTRAANLHHMWRVAPRIAYRAGSVRMAPELEATSVRYSAAYSSRFEPIRTEADDAVFNLRTLVAVYYYF